MTPPPSPPSSPPPPEQRDPADALDRPSLTAALVLLVPGAICAGLFYLWLRDWTEALVYGGMLGCGGAAVAVEFIKYMRSLHEHPDEGGSPARKAATLALAAFRLGFFKTFWEIMRELLKLAGLKVIISILFAIAAFFAARAVHLF